MAMANKKQYVGTKAVGKGKECLRIRLRNAVVMLAVSLVASAALAAPTVQDIEFSSRPGSKFEVRVEFNETPPDFKTYAIEKPARIAVDFPGTTSSLEQKRFSLPYGNATKAVVLESGDRTRLVRRAGQAGSLRNPRGRQQPVPGGRPGRRRLCQAGQ